MTDTSEPRAWHVALAFAAIYLIWGSTYLAMRIGIATLPPFVLVAGRYLVAGGILYVVVRLRGAPRPRVVHWRSAAIIGGLLLVCGNGAVTHAERVVPSGVAALIVATVPVWMTVIDAVWGGGGRPGGRVILGLAAGLAGIGLLVGPGSFGGGGIDRFGALILVLGSMCWAAGSIYSRRAPLPRPALLGTAMEMVAGGVLSLVAAAVSGELWQLQPARVSGASLLAVGYLVVFGSLIGFTAYVWLLAHVAPTRVATYAYVNPVIAVLLGWALAGEPLTARMLLAGAVILAAVVLITTSPSTRKPRGPLAGAECEEGGAAEPVAEERQWRARRRRAG